MAKSQISSVFFILGKGLGEDMVSTGMMEVHLESLWSSAFSPTSIDTEEQQHRWVSGQGSGESLEEPAQLILLLLSRQGLRNPQ